MTDALNIEEQAARIEQLKADVMLKLLDSLKRAQDIQFAPLTMLATGAASAAALIGAGVALAKWVT